MKSFCEILRELREDRDMTQADVANLLGTSQQYYSKYETGKYEMPIHYVVPLADFYGVSVDYLLGRTACRVRLEEYQKPIVAGYTADELLADVLTLPLLVREKGSGLRKMVDDLLEREQVHARIVTESMSVLSLIEFCERGMGVLIVPESVAAPYLQQKRLKHIRVTDANLTREYYMRSILL